jgi:regulatory protein
VPAGETGPDADPEQVARAIVLKQLTQQPRTKVELARALSRRGVPDEVAEHVLGRFSEVGLIDDAAFAQAWVESRHAGRGLARRALAHELRRRGVDDRDVSAAVEQLSPDTELATARALVQRKLASTRKLDPPVRLRRLAGMLARKGYPSTIALTVVREALASEGDDALLDGYLDAFDTEDPDDLP